MAELIASLAKLRAQFNALAPGRDKESDGWIGDAAHQAEKSDHNPDARGLVHAIDVDADLRTDGVSMERVVQFLVARARAGVEKRLKYVIYNRRIWSASSGWVQKTYTGKSPHTEHAHFSGSSDPVRERDTSDWHLGDIDTMTAAQMQELKDFMAKEIRAVVDDRKGDYAQATAQATWDHKFPRVNPTDGQGNEVTAGALQQFSEATAHAEADRVIAALSDNSTPEPTNP